MNDLFDDLGYSSNLKSIILLITFRITMKMLILFKLIEKY